MLKVHNIDLQKYNSDILYKMIKVSKISYEMLTKEVLLDVILKAEKNSQTGQNTNKLIKNKANYYKSRMNSNGKTTLEKTEKCIVKGNVNKKQDFTAKRKSILFHYLIRNKMFKKCKYKQ